MKKLKIAAFGGFRTIPPKPGAAGADKFAFELYPRLVKQGHMLIAYCRIYPDEGQDTIQNYKGVEKIFFKTVRKAGFDSLLHSFKATCHILVKNTADVVHIQSGANSIWALLLRLGGKKVIISQFAMDWKRDKWPWYGKLFYLISNYFTAYFPNSVVFDNIFTKKFFEKKFKKKFHFIPYGSEVKKLDTRSDILSKLGLHKNDYFLFVGRFIPDKGIHLLIDAFNQINSDKKLVLVGGSPNPSEYEANLLKTTNDKIILPGYIYGNDTNFLMKHAYVYIQPSLIEGLSPVILTVMRLGTPIICSDIVENKYITKNNATHFVSGEADSLKQKIEYSLNNYNELKQKAKIGREDISKRFNWDQITDQFIKIFKQ